MQQLGHTPRGQSREAPSSVGHWIGLIHIVHIVSFSFFRETTLPFKSFARLVFAQCG